MKCVLKYMKEGSAKLILVYGELFSQSWQMIGTHTHTTQFWALGMMCGTLLLKTHQNIPVTPYKLLNERYDRIYLLHSSKIKVTNFPQITPPLRVSKVV